jgi:hypothetical protein
MTDGVNPLLSGIDMSIQLGKHKNCVHGDQMWERPTIRLARESGVSGNIDVD